MLKVLHVLSFLTVLWISAVICEDCLFTDQTWGSTNPTEIIFCDSKTNKTQVSNCRNGYGFKSNETVSGCIAWEDWNHDCILRQNVRKIDSCEGTNSANPHPIQGDPTSYILCSNSSSPPLVMHCPKNRGFVAFEGYLGCIPWESWRNITGCTA